MFGFLQNTTEKLRNNRKERWSRTKDRINSISDIQQSPKDATVPPSKWKQKADKLREERPARREQTRKRVEEIRAKSKAPKSKVAQRVDWFVAPLAAVGGFIIVESHTWPTPWLKSTFAHYGMRGDLFTFIPIGIGCMLLLSPMRYVLVKQLEKKFGDSPE
jgi:hypothetical protein